MGKLYRDLVRQHSKAKGSARALLNILADYATDEGLAWPTRATLANDTGMSERTVTRALQALCDDGRLILEDNAAGGRGRVPLYRIVFPAHEKGDNVTPKRGSDCHPLHAERVTNGQIKGDNLTVKGDKFAGILSYARSEPQLTETTEPEKEIAADAASPSHPDAVSVSEKPKPKRSRKKPDPPSSDVPPQREPTEWQLFLEAMCWVCHGHKSLNVLTEIQKGALTSEAKRICDNGRTIDDLRKWFATVWQPGWQWQKNKGRPKPSEVRSSLPALDSETPEGFEVDHVVVGNNSNATSNRQAVHSFFAKARAAQGVNGHG